MSDQITITIDGQQIKVKPGQKLLWAALDNGIYIPHLCAIREEERPNASCRLCFVEIKGINHPVTSCTRTVEDNMIVKTRSPRIDRLVKTAFELIISDHNLKCSECPANKNCALQTIARERGIRLKQKRFKSIVGEFELDDSPEVFAFDRSRCVLWRQRWGQSALPTGASRGLLPLLKICPWPSRSAHSAHSALMPVRWAPYTTRKIGKKPVIVPVKPAYNPEGVNS